MDTRPYRAETEHRIPFLLFLRTFLLLSRGFGKEAFNRVTATGTGPFLKLAAFFAHRDLGRQKRREMVLPEQGINFSLLKETLDMPCRVFHARNVRVFSTYALCIRVV